MNILFNITQANFAFFGEKDFQQLAVIKKMVKDLRIPINIIPVETVREPSGLALSSRNQRLSAEAKLKAACIYAALQAGQELASTCKDPAIIKHLVYKNLADLSNKIEYVEIVDEDSLELLNEIPEHARLLVALELDGVRLIDNIRI